MLMSEYMALMNLMRVLGFKQNPKELTKFYITCNGDIKAQVVDEPDDVVVDKDGRVEDFSGDRIHPRRPHRVHRGVRDVPDA